MKKSRTILILLTIVLLLFCANVMSQDISQLIPKIKDAIVTVYAEDESGTAFSSGSGFFISPDICVTNFHVLQGASGGRIKCTNGQEYTIQYIEDYNPKYDLVKFVVNNTSLTKFSYLNLSQNLPQQGSFVVNYGSPLGTFDNTVSTGIVSAIREYNNYEKVIQITAPISHGSSGSPVMDQFGNVIGIATFGVESGQSLNFAVSSIQLKKLSRHLYMPVSKMRENELETELLKRGVQMAMMGRYNDAIKLFDEEIKNSPNNHLAYFYRGLWKCRGISNDEGISDLLMACQMDVQYEYYIKACEFIKNSLIQMDVYGYRMPENAVNLAMSMYGKCIEMEPLRADAYAGLGYLLLYIGKNWGKKELYETAIQYLSIAIEIIPDNQSYLLYRADAYDKTKNWGMEILDCNRAIALNDKFYRPYFCRGTVRAIELGQYDDGIMDLIIADALVDDNFQKSEINAMIASAYARKFLGSKNSSMKDLSQAKNYALIAYKLNPSNSNKSQLEYINSLSK